MRNILALLCVFLMAAHQSTILLTKGESIKNTIHSIVYIARTTLVHIKKLELPALIEVPTPSIEGLKSISHELGVLDNELRQHPFLIQIQADVSSLERIVRSFANSSMECPLEPKPAVQTDESEFPDSHLYMTVAKVQHYLEKLLLNKGKLKVC